MLPTSIIIHVFFFLLLLLLLASATSSATGCSSTCGPHKLPYPFGFSSTCPIRLLCSPHSSILLPSSAGGEFPVEAVTSDAILVSLKPSRLRPLSSLRRLSSPNYAPTRRNAFLLANCTRPFSTCSIPTTLLRARFDLSNNNLSCYSHRAGFLDPDEVIGRTGCGALFSSILSGVDTSPEIEANETPLAVGESVVALEFEVVELRWWLLGPCGCSIGAHCVHVSSPGIGLGFRCRCPSGFTGDAYAHGLGCRKKVPSACNKSKYINGKCSGLTKVSVLITGVASGASLALVSLASLCLCFHRKHHITKFRKFTKHHLSDSSTICIPIYTYKEIQRATNFFSEEHRLGTGAYGTVYRANLRNYEVAIKRIKHRDTNESIEQVINEIKLLSSVSHPNLVHLLGCSIENTEEQILVYEYMPNGTLCQHLQRERGEGLSWPVRLTIANETAQAIAYLHSGLNPPIYHRDIKSSNILLDHNFKPKVADFGLSRFGLPESSHVSTAPQGTPGYLDPQYHQCFHLSDKSDVYSFGVVLAEIITGLKVVDFYRASDEVNLAAFVVDRIGKGQVEEIIDPFLKQDESVVDSWITCSIHKVAELAFRCLAYHQDMRPTMVEVAFELEQMVGSWIRDSVDEADSSALLRRDFLCSSSSLSSDVDFGVIVKKARVGSLGFYMVQKEVSCESSVMDMEDASDHVSTQESWSSQHSSPFIK